MSPVAFESSPSPTPEEAAAIAAAIERFAHDTAPPARAGTNELDPWTRSALLEGVSGKDDADVPHPWINT
ncbi:MAG TPA: hypothetical protein VMG62_00465 [Solirubrobacteraceae bacterium]|nr:hypothetical protein [Solirubrobacteraceae bacterium]